MKISAITRLEQVVDKLAELARALDNRLTAGDNLGPEGQKWQVLTSRGPRDVDPPPTFMDIRDILEGISLEDGEDGDGLPGLEGPPGPAGPAGPAGLPGEAGFVPTTVRTGETFTLPADKQALFVLPIEVEPGGSLDIQGALIEVDVEAPVLRGIGWSKGGDPVDLLGETFGLTPEMQVNGVVSACKIKGRGTGSATFGVKRTSTWPTGLVDVTGGVDPAIVAASAAEVSLVGWDPAVLEGDVFEFELKTVSGFTHVQIVLEITPT